MMVLKALSSIAVEQMNATDKTMARCTQLLDYLSHNANAKVRFYASDMILNIYSDASYFSEAKARSHTCGHFFHGLDAKKWRAHLFEQSIPCQLNYTAIHCHISGGSRTWCVIPQFPNGHNFQTHMERNGTPATKNTCTLQ
jgi:hypothetical protein